MPSETNITLDYRCDTHCYLVRNSDAMSDTEDHATQAAGESEDAAAITDLSPEVRPAPPPPPLRPAPPVRGSRRTYCTINLRDAIRYVPFGEYLTRDACSMPCSSIFHP